MHKESFLLFLIFFPGVVLGVSPAEPSSRPPKDKRESVCLGNAIKFYNLTMDFQDKMAVSSKQEYFDELVNKDGAQLREMMTVLENKLSVFITEMEAGGGIAPKTENITTEVEQFSLEIEVEYKAVTKTMKSLLPKFLESNTVFRNAKKALMDDTEEFTKLRAKHIALCTLFDLSWYFSQSTKNEFRGLEKYYKELDVIEDQVTPILEKYQEVSDIPPDSKDGQLFFSGLDRVEVLESKKIRQLLDSNDDMLRQFERIVNDSVEKARSEIDNLSKTFDGMKQEVINHAQEIVEIDGRIQKLIGKQNKLLEAANVLALERALKNMKSKESKDEL